MKSIIIIVIILGLVVIGAAALYLQQGLQDEKVQLLPGAQSEDTGRVVFTITDAAANMGSVNSVKVTIDKMQAHSEAEGWSKVSSRAKTYDLLELKSEGKQELLADVQLKEGIYNQVWLDISEVIITDAQGVHEAKLPSKQIIINGKVVVKSNSTSSVTFDFIADESLHVTGKGEYIMAPVVAVEAKQHTRADVKSNNRVVIEGGATTSSSIVGMDLTGKVGIGVRVPANIILNIGSDNMIEIGDIISSSSSASGNTSLDVGLGSVVFG